MEVLACGLIEFPGLSRVCGHPIELGLGCPACDRAVPGGEEPDLVRICEGSVDRVAEHSWGELLGWRDAAAQPGRYGAAVEEISGG